MATVNFTQNLKRHIECPSLSIEGETLQEVLANLFRENPKLGCYILDNQGQLRKHMMIAIDGKMVNSRQGLSDKTNSDSEVFIMQALSGG